MSEPRRTHPAVGWYGDDFTGATDTLANLSEAGLRALLFLGIPSAARLAAAGNLDAIGIAGAARAMAPGPMAAELDPVGRFFAARNVAVLHYKVCSTFDSAPAIGNIGTAIATLRPYCPSPLLPIIGGQPNLGRYCLFGTLFAAAGTGGAVHRIDRHPTMARHPVTPMHEADLIRHLAAQGVAPTALFDYRAYAGDAEAALEHCLSDAPAAVLMDVAREDDLAVIGRLIWRHAAQSRVLAVGASSVARALAAASPQALPRPPAVASPARGAGPILVLAGSLSPVSRAQAAAVPDFARQAIDPARLARDPGALAACARQAAEALAAGRHVLVQTTRPEGVAMPPAEAAAATGRLARAILALHVPGLLVVAGGDTSSHAVQALGLWALGHAGTAAPGVACCIGYSDERRLNGLPLVLKGGQMGPPDLFARLAADAQASGAGGSIGAG